MTTSTTLRRWATRLCLVPLLAFAGAELFARYVVGLGDPPLTQRDPQLDYVFVPSRCYERFHHRVCYNRYSMRSEELSPQREDACERRVLVLGDSIINGGANLDQSQIGTEIARRLLARAGLPSTVANVSAGSWGPANLRAYTDRYGWFDADVAVFVFNGEDVVDLPDFAPDLGPEYPLETPALALCELSRYAPRLLPGVFGAAENPAGPAPHVDPTLRARGLAALQGLLEQAAQHVATRIVLFHAPAAQLAEESPESESIRTISLQTGARFVSLRPRERASLYVDSLHLNAEGQALLGQVIFEEARPALARCTGARR